MISKKVILTGSFGVGKTSLFTRFIYQDFSDKYLTTIGVKVNKKEISVDDRDISLLLWDIAGEVSQDKVPISYFLGAAGIVYVVDLTRPSTFVNMKNDLEFLRKKLPDATIIVVANKRDLLDDVAYEALYDSVEQKWDFVTSAKTGENVETMFMDLGKKLLDNTI